MMKAKPFTIRVAIVAMMWVSGESVRGEAPKTPPKDGQWTIYCTSVRGPTHVEQSKSLKEWLMKNSSLRDWYVVHGDQESTIYHGFYRTINDAKDNDTKRARADRAWIDGFEGNDGVRPFAQCMFVETSSPDPTAPTEWNLTNAKGAYTLEIAVYKDSPLRKEAAVDSVREARKRGIEAYFYHGATASSVCIGAWPLEAVSVTQQDGGARRSGEETLMVLPFAMRGAAPKDLTDDQGNPVRVMAPKFEATDPTLLATMKQYQEFSVNGTVVPKKVKRPDGSEAVDIQKSQLMEIPREPESMLTALPARAPVESVGPRVVGGPEPTPDTPRPVRPKPTGTTGRLKSIGD